MIEKFCCYDIYFRIETLYVKNKKKVPRQPAATSMVRISNILSSFVTKNIIIFVSVQSPKPSESPVPVRSTQSSAPPTQSPKEPSSSPVHTAQSLAPPRPSSPVAKALDDVC